jgi:hypothetical protein
MQAMQGALDETTRNQSQRVIQIGDFSAHIVQLVFATKCGTSICMALQRSYCSCRRAVTGTEGSTTGNLRNPIRAVLSALPLHHQQTGRVRVRMRLTSGHEKPGSVQIGNAHVHAERPGFMGLCLAAFQVVCFLAAIAPNCPSKALAYGHSHTPTPVVRLKEITDQSLLCSLTVCHLLCSSVSFMLCSPTTICAMFREDLVPHPVSQSIVNVYSTNLRH